MCFGFGLLRNEFWVIVVDLGSNLLSSPFFFVLFLILTNDGLTEVMEAR